MNVTIKVARDRRGQYRTWCPSLPGCEASGRSRPEAISSIDPAIRGYLASLNRAVPGEIKKVIETPGRGMSELMSVSRERKEQT